MAIIDVWLNTEFVELAYKLELQKDTKSCTCLEFFKVSFCCRAGFD